MNCVELQQSLAEVEDGSTPEQSTHLKTCAECSELVKELRLIAAKASELQASDEPSPRVWNSIEIALRQEGLIRPQNVGRPSTIPSFRARWGAARWLVPAAAMLLLVLGVYERRQSFPNPPPPEAALITPAVNPSGLNDEDLIQEVAANAPAMQSQYTENLQRVNEYIRDAQSVVNDNPNDEEARRSLMDAYQQKSMLFEMAMDRSLP
jgi:hypothetical protein